MGCPYTPINNVEELDRPPRTVNGFERRRPSGSTMVDVVNTNERCRMDTPTCCAATYVDLVCVNDGSFLEWGGGGVEGNGSKWVGNGDGS